MADLISNQSTSERPDRLASSGPNPDTERDAPTGDDDVDVLSFIELLFFAYREFVRDPDSILEEFGFGRAHHRVLHFVCRHPGIRVARLLDVLNITKQSLARVLRQLIEDGYVEQRTGENDRRERRLFLTEAGNSLVGRLMAPQKVRVAAALEQAGIHDHSAVERFLVAMIAEPDRSHICRLIEEGAPIGTISATEQSAPMSSNPGQRIDKPEAA